MRHRETLAMATVVCVAAMLPMVQVAGQTSAPEKAGYLLKEEPKGAKAVMKIRKESKDGEDVIVVGRIGGRKNPWVKGAAVFSIVDESIKSCDQIPGDTCPTPWDYCCEANLPQKTLLLLFVDDAGKVVKKDAREMLKVKELQTVVVKGKVKRDKANNVTILATNVFVRSDKRILQ